MANTGVQGRGQFLGLVHLSSTFPSWSMAGETVPSSSVRQSKLTAGCDVNRYRSRNLGGSACKLRQLDASPTIDDRLPLTGLYSLPKMQQEQQMIPLNGETVLHSPSTPLFLACTRAAVTAGAVAPVVQKKSGCDLQPHNPRT